MGGKMKSDDLFQESLTLNWKWWPGLGNCRKMQCDTTDKLGLTSKQQHVLWEGWVWCKGRHTSQLEKPFISHSAAFENRGSIFCRLCKAWNALEVRRKCRSIEELKAWNSNETPGRLSWSNACLTFHFDGLNPLNYELDYLSEQWFFPPSISLCFRLNATVCLSLWSPD